MCETLNQAEIFYFRYQKKIILKSSDGFRDSLFSDTAKRKKKIHSLFTAAAPQENPAALRLKQKSMILLRC